MAFWTALLIKAVATASIVVIASVAAEAVGPFWGGLIISLPIAAGPAYVMLALQHDAGFIAVSALGSFTTNAATFVLLTVFALLAPHHRRPVVIGGGLSAWLLAVLAIHAFDWSLSGALLLNLLVIALAHWLTRPAARAPALPRGALRRRWFELPMRAALVGLVVASVVTGSRALGPGMTGMAAVFPVAFTSFAFLVLPRLGGAASAAVMAGAVRAMPGFALSLLALHLAAEPLGTWGALLAMIATSLLWSAGMLLWRPAPCHAMLRQNPPRKRRMDANHIAEAAALLVAARRGRSRIPLLPPSCCPTTVAEAHAIQDAVTAALGTAVGAFKANAPAGSAPTRGVIYTPTVHASPSRIPAALVPQCGVEGEIAFVFRTDLPPRATPYSREEVAAAVDACAAIEVVTSRYADPDAASMIDKLADCISNGAFVHGKVLSDWQGLALGKLKVTLTVNGAPVLKQIGGHPTGDPLGIAVVLVEMMRGAGGVKAGQFVTCGSCTGVRYLKPGDVCGVQFEGLGAAEVTFSA